MIEYNQLFTNSGGSVTDFSKTLKENPEQIKQLLDQLSKLTKNSNKRKRNENEFDTQPNKKNKTKNN
jgi:hypothetical protein